MKTLTKPVTIRRATPDDAAAISGLVVTVASQQLRNEFTDDGWDLFLRLISKQTQQGLIADSQFCYWLAYYNEPDQEQLVGVLTSKNQFHLFHFFILPEYQNQGIGKQLWTHYLFHLPAPPPQLVSVKASDFALGFYQKLGFIAQQPRCVENGLAYTLMHYVRRDN
jgi:ribosomal protein S18 acetylase RimI-like enzyme